VSPQRQGLRQASSLYLDYIHANVPSPRVRHVFACGLSSQFMVASHNQESVQFTLEEMAKRKISPGTNGAREAVRARGALLWCAPFPEARSGCTRLCLWLRLFFSYSLISFEGCP
jgi:hypothetical protein